MTGYPRDLVGYADQPPDPRWLGGARLALNFVVNYEEGGERSVLSRARPSRRVRFCCVGWAMAQMRGCTTAICGCRSPGAAST
jgi:hypothetical protein